MTLIKSISGFGYYGGIPENLTPMMPSICSGLCRFIVGATPKSCAVVLGRDARIRAYAL